jgi:multidrug efflux pump subunit AcrB
MNSVIIWFIKNPVAANLLMIILVVAGLFSVKNINNEFFPNFQPNLVSVSVPYPGAGPLEVEEQICLKIEEAISDVAGIKEITSTASQGLGRVLIETVEDWDVQQMLQDAKTRVDAISTFPLNAERPIVSDVSFGNEVLDVVVYGGNDELAIKSLALAMKDEISRIAGVSEVDINGVRDSQVTVEITENTLRAYGLSLNDIARTIKRSSLNLPAGQMHNKSGDIQLQIYGQGYTAADFENIVIVSDGQSGQVTLGQIAKISDSFEEKNFLVEFNGQKAAQLTVVVNENPDTIGTSQRVNDYLNAQRNVVPDGFQMTIRNDRSEYLRDRLDILAKNSAQGLSLVFILLLLFLRPRLALWVSVGIAVAYLATIAVMFLLGSSINVTSTFAFLLILGIVVDDAIVVSENIYSMHERNIRGHHAAIKGVTMIAKPVVLAVLTTLIVFVPMLAMKGTMGQIFSPIPIVAITALTFSLVEALLIMPSHLSHLPAEKESSNILSKMLFELRRYFTNTLNKFSINIYQPLLARSLANSLATLAFFVAVLMICLSAFVGGWVPLRFSPSIELENVVIRADFQEGVGYEHVLDIEEQIIRGVDAVRGQADMLGYDGKTVFTGRYAVVDSNVVQVDVGLTRNSDREISTQEILKRTKAAIGEVSGVENFVVSTSLFGLDKDVGFRLAGSDLKSLDAASAYLKNILQAYDGVVEVTDSLSSARQELRVELKPYAEVLGVRLEDVARQVRHAFYGAEAQRIPQLREDVKVMVRYPPEQRGSIEFLDDMRIQLDNGVRVPFSEVASATFTPGYTTIERANRERVISVTANVTPGIITASELVQAVLANSGAQFNEKFPHVSLALEGEQEEQGEFMSYMLVGAGFALFLIYTVLAIEFQSYLQPFYILVAVPFGVAGAIIGHLITGLPFSMPSVMGVLATAGVVVNANLVLIDYINKLRVEGMSIIDAVEHAARNRLRPIILTSITTFFGLMPVIIEPSPAADALKPVVVSLSFGVLFATLITLLMVPAMYLNLESLKLRLGFRERASVDLSA